MNNGPQFLSATSPSGPLTKERIAEVCQRLFGKRP
jgi:hypothetical protein